jgi:hypothetical protein
MSENRDHTGRTRTVGGTGADAAGEPSARDDKQPAHKAAEPSQVKKPAPEVELHLPRSVLAQRVIALNGPAESSESKALDHIDRIVRKKVWPFDPGASHSIYNARGVDLTTTALEWGGRRLGIAAEAARAPKPGLVLQQRAEFAAPAARAPKEAGDAQWATHSSIALELYDDSPLSPRILSSNIEDAVTREYHNPVTAKAAAARAVVPDLAGLDQALETAGVLDTGAFGLVTSVREAQTPEPMPAPPELAPAAPLVAAPLPLAAAQPYPAPAAASATALALDVPPQHHVFIVPATMAWTFLGVLSVCALGFLYLALAFFACGNPSFFDPTGPRCVPRADVGVHAG